MVTINLVLEYFMTTSILYGRSGETLHYIKPVNCCTEDSPELCQHPFCVLWLLTNEDKDLPVDLERILQIGLIGLYTIVQMFWVSRVLFFVLFFERN